MIGGIFLVTIIIAIMEIIIMTMIKFFIMLYTCSGITETLQTQYDMMAVT